MHRFCRLKLSQRCHEIYDERVQKTLRKQVYDREDISDKQLGTGSKRAV